MLRRPPVFPPVRNLHPGWIDIQTEEEGVILVNAAQVAYVRDIEDAPVQVDPSLSGVGGQPVSGRFLAEAPNDQPSPVRASLIAVAVKPS